MVYHAEVCIVLVMESSAVIDPSNVVSKSVPRTSCRCGHPESEMGGVDRCLPDLSGLRPVGRKPWFREKRWLDSEKRRHRKQT